MYNCLLDGFPTEYRGHRINTDYRFGVLISLLLEDESIEEDLRTIKALDLLYVDTIPDDIDTATDGLHWFLSLGRSELYLEEENDEKDLDKAIDFNLDALDIWATFKSKFGIDLIEDDLHWFAFMSLISNLTECPLSQKIGYRVMDLSKFKGETKKQYAELKEKYRIKRVLTKEEHDIQIETIKSSPLFGKRARQIMGLE